MFQRGSGNFKVFPDTFHGRFGGVLGSIKGVSECFEGVSGCHKVFVGVSSKL